MGRVTRGERVKDFNIVDDHGNIVCAFRFTEAYASVYVSAMGDILLGYVTEAREMSNEDLRAILAPEEGTENA